jgi:hypothetical protein
VPLRPAEVHPEEHLRPVGRLGASGAGADREDRGTFVVLAGEEQLGALPIEVPGEGLALAIALGRELLVAGLPDELAERLELGGAALEAAPQLDDGPLGVGLAEDPLGGSLVVPEARDRRQRFELAEVALPGGKVKDAPTSTGSARPGRGRLRRPSVPDLEILEQDRSELDQAQGRLAPGDDGVHAGTVAVVGTDAAVAVAVERRRVAAGPAVAFAGDQIDEGRFLSLLHDSLTSHTDGHAGRGTGDGIGNSGDDAGWEWPEV